MEILDPFAQELLLARPPPPALDFSPGVGSDAGTSMDIAQLDDYLRAIGVLPPLPPPAAHVDASVAPLPSHSAASSHDDGSAAALDACYDSDIDASLRAAEADAREWPSPGYLDGARGVLGPAAARAALVAWMSGFAQSFGIGPAALHRAVSYADRFLSAGGVITARATDDVEYRLRLLGAAAVYAAAKHEDSGTTRRVNAGDIAASCGFAAGQEVVAAERALLAALGYRLGGPTAHTFVEHFTRHAGVAGEGGLRLRRAAHAIAGSSLVDHRCLRLLPSAVAAAAILLARMSLEPAHDLEQLRRWGLELEELTGYKPVDVYDGLHCMYEMMPEYPGFAISPLLFADPSCYC